MTEVCVLPEDKSVFLNDAAPITLEENTNDSVDSRSNDAQDIEKRRDRRKNATLKMLERNGTEIQ